MQRRPPFERAPFACSIAHRVVHEPHETDIRNCRSGSTPSSGFACRSSPRATGERSRFTLTVSDTKHRIDTRHDDERSSSEPRSAMSVAVAGGRPHEYSHADIDSRQHDTGRTEPDVDTTVTNPKP